MNVWVALTYGAHEHHEIARTWFDSVDSEERVCFCRFTQISLLRLLTTPAVMGADEVMTQAQAWDAYDRWTQDSRILFLEEPPGVEHTFRAFSSRTRTSSKNWGDSYLAAFAEVGGLKFVTFDKGFQGRMEKLLVLKT